MTAHRFGRWLVALAIGGQLLVACSPTSSPSEAALLREEVVSLVTSGELGPQGVVDDEVELPENLAEASEGGSIAMTRNDEDGLTVVFFSRRGVVDDWTGYVYRSEEGVTDDPLGGGGPIVVRDLGQGWFYVEAS